MKLPTSILLLTISFFNLSTTTALATAPRPNPITHVTIDPNAGPPDRDSTESVPPRPIIIAAFPGQGLPKMDVSPAHIDFSYWVCEDVNWGGACVRMRHATWNGECAVFPDSWQKRISTVSSPDPNQTCRFFTNRNCSGAYLELVTPEEADDLRKWGPGPEGADGMNDVIASVSCWKPMPPRDWFDCSKKGKMESTPEDVDMMQDYCK